MPVVRTLGALAASGVLAVRQRLELAALDVQDELVAWIRLLGGALAVAVFCALTLAGLGAAIVIALWDSWRIAAIAGVTVAYLAGAILSWQRLLRAWAAKPPFMAATIAELRRDGEELAQP
jgi:uncharacterized membrane protein YqjE